ncbi:MAG: hypothetical protein EBY17_28840 [Acidobacteriia bacterium]|nr:hypothetical protein [Terriglobia bacterium]
MDWARILAYVTGTVDQELLGRNEYLAAGNDQEKGNVLLFPRNTDQQREGRCSVASDWVGSCATIIVRRRDGASAGSVFWPYEEEQKRKDTMTSDSIA